MLLTLGHSNLAFESFVSRLETHDVEHLVDVRSVPFSSFTPQFDRPSLERRLPRHVKYSFMGRHLGGRVTSPRYLLEGGRVDYRAIAAASWFQEGIADVLELAKSERVALVCSEGEPLDCHRCILIAPCLVREGCDVGHVLPDGSLEPHAATMRRLLACEGLGFGDLFRDESALVEDALARRAAKIAYVVRPSEAAGGPQPR